MIFGLSFSSPPSSSSPSFSSSSWPSSPTSSSWSSILSSPSTFFLLFFFFFFFLKVHLPKDALFKGFHFSWGALTLEQKPRPQWMSCAAVKKTKFFWSLPSFFFKAWMFLLISSSCWCTLFIFASDVSLSFIALNILLPSSNNSSICSPSCPSVFLVLLHLWRWRRRGSEMFRYSSDVDCPWDHVTICNPFRDFRTLS